MEKERLLLFSGDIHGELKKIVWKVCIQLGIRNSSLIVAGDFGVGFGRPGAMDVLYGSVKKRLEEYDLTIYVVRGNHDDPSYFDGLHDYPRVKFLRDHETYEIEGKTIYVLGGAHSIDRVSRIEEDQVAEKYGSKKRTWWKDEPIVKKYEDLPEKVDIIVSHEAPLSFDPVIVRKLEDLELWRDVLDSRSYLNHVLGEVNTDWWIHGHYHKSTSGTYINTRYRGLGIEEIFCLPNEG